MTNQEDVYLQQLMNNKRNYVPSSPCGGGFATILLLLTVFIKKMNPFYQFV